VRIEWHPLARANLAGLVVYIATDDVSAAYRVHDSIREQIERLATHSELGRPGRIRGTRELVISRTL
jgi:toxin ParE1/3/4